MCMLQKLSPTLLTNKQCCVSLKSTKYYCNGTCPAPLVNMHTNLIEVSEQKFLVDGITSIHHRPAIRQKRFQLWRPFLRSQFSNLWQYLTNTWVLFCVKLRFLYPIKRRMSWVGHVTCTGQKRNVYRSLVGRSQGMKWRAKPMHR